MKHFSAALAAMLAVAAATLQPVAGAAAPAPRVLVLTSRLVSIQQPGERDGQLRLMVYPDGIVSGNYRDTEGHLSSVTGGVNPSGAMWLEIGALNPLIFTGTLTGSAIDVTAFNRDAGFELTAAP
jgi:hypothetical protein